MAKWCIWCQAAPTTAEWHDEYCSKKCFGTHKADPCSLCKQAPGRIFWELGCFLCTNCGFKELRRVQEEYEKILYREKQLAKEK